MRDPYTVLGVSKSASEADIKKAFRRLAKQYHPDRASDDPSAKEKFAEANQAYEIVGDPTKRAQFDRGEIGADGKPRFQGFEGFTGTGHPGAGPGGFEFNFGRGGASGARADFDPADIFGDLFGRANAGRRRSSGPPKGEDLETELAVTLAEAASGGTRRLRLPSGREIEVTIPKGAADGKVMRLKGLGHPSAFPGGAPGDILLTLRLAPDPRFAIEGRDLRTKLSVPLADAVLGGPVRVPTLSGEVEMRLPPMTSSGKSFRLRGRGLPAEGPGDDGDLYAVVEIVLPAEDAELTALMRRRKES